MKKNRDIVLGDRTFTIPRLPIIVNRVVYPLCARLSAGGMIERSMAAGILVCSSEEYDDMLELAFTCANFVDPSFTHEQLNDLNPTPAQLFDALFLIRYQTGVWIAVESKTESEQSQGEAKGTKRPRK